MDAGGSVALSDNVFAKPSEQQTIIDTVKAQLSNERLGTVNTKTRSEVSGGGRKPWRQKGTGRARQGSIRSAQWKGGGRIHTPHPRSYVQSMPRKMRLAALRSALSVKAAEECIIVVDELKVAEPKTRLMASALNTLVGNNSVLILIPQKRNTRMLSALPITCQRPKF